MTSERQPGRSLPERTQYEGRRHGQELWVEDAPVSPLAPPLAGRSSARERVKSFEKF